MEINSTKMLSIVLNVTFAKGTALESALLSLAGQIYRPCELIVVFSDMSNIDMQQWKADISTRWSPSFAAIRFLPIQDSLTNGQRYAEGLKSATGSYVALMDDAHRIYPYTYLTLVQYLESHPECSWAFANIGVVLENEYHQVVQRIDPDPARSYKGVDYFEVDEICLPGIVIDRERVSSQCNLEELFCKVSSSSATALLALQSKPGHVSILGGELRQAQAGFTKKSSEQIHPEIDRAILPWWLMEFQTQQLEAKDGGVIQSESTLQRQLEEMQSSYYRQLYVAYRQSTSGKITRVILRNLPWGAAMHTKISQYPSSEIEAIDKIIAMQSLMLWDLTAPVRWFGKIRQSIKG